MKMHFKRILSYNPHRPIGLNAIDRQLNANWNSWFDRPKYFSNSNHKLAKDREHQYLTFVVYRGCVPKYMVGREEMKFYAPSSYRLWRRPVKGMHSHGKTRKYANKRGKK